MLYSAGIEDPSVKLNIELCDEHFGLHLKLFSIFHFVLECENFQVEKVCSAKFVSGYYTLDIEKVHSIPTQHKRWSSGNIGLI